MNSSAPTMKKVSVIVPMYGVAKYIGDTISSVLAQTHSNFELLLVDDGSPDNTVEICRTFSDPRIRILRQPNQGPAAARNFGVHEATGDFIAFIDGDDLWEPEKLAIQVAHLESNPSVGVSFCRSAFIDSEGRSLGIYQVLTKLEGISLLDILCRTPIGNGSVPVIRREVIDDLKHAAGQPGVTTGELFNPDRAIFPSEDVECWSRIALCTDWQIAGVPDALTLYRIHSRGNSANLEKKRSSFQKVLRLVQQYGGEAGQAVETVALAYHDRYLARRAVSLRDGATAIQFMHRSIGSYPSIFWEEPYRTLQSLIAAYLLALMPDKIYIFIEQQLRQTIGAVQKLKLNTNG